MALVNREAIKPTKDFTGTPSGAFVPHSSCAALLLSKEPRQMGDGYKADF